MKKLPTIICTSTVRSAQQGESHGGIYLVDLNSENFHQIIDWDSSSIDWEGRGSDRGLRGIAFYKGHVICAASDEFLIYDKDFNVVKSFSNKYLRHCHELFVNGDLLYLTSTGFDSILEFDLKNEQFTRGFMYRFTYLTKSNYISAIQRKTGLIKKEFKAFDPNQENGPSLLDSVHINNVFVKDNSIFFSGTGLSNLMKINQDQHLETVSQIPKGTHNVMFHKEFLVFNNTANNTIDIKKIDTGELIKFDILQYNINDLINSDTPNDHARQGFGRGLCCTGDYIIGGSSPGTISLYSIEEKRVLKTINLTMDIKTAIHGLEVFPFEFHAEKFEKKKELNSNTIA